MSFCSSVKSELLNLRLPHCCQAAFCYGFMLFGKAFSVKKIAFQTSNDEIAHGYVNAIFSCYGVRPDIRVGGSINPTFVAEVTSEADRLKILAANDFGMNGSYIDESVFIRDCCFSSFVRGAFLACGNINDPEKEYRLEFNIKSETAALELQALLLREAVKLKSTKYGKGLKLYTKDSAVIEDLLTFMGDTRHSLELMETKVVKSVKNGINRAGNCDSANITKTIEASIKQRRAIEYLQKKGRLESLEPELLKAAKLRTQNPDAALKELVKISGEPITVSGLNHRLKRIIEIYEETKNKLKNKE